MNLIPGLCRIEILILGDLADPDNSQIIASSHPDLSAEQWAMVGRYILDTLGAGQVSTIVVEEDAQGRPSFTNTKDLKSN